MNRPGIQMAASTITMLAIAGFCWCIVSPSDAFPNNPQRAYSALGSGRPDNLCGLIHQTYGGAWENTQKDIATFNTLGLYAAITTYMWNPEIADWTADGIVEYTYREDNRFQHADIKTWLDGAWSTYRTVDWTYDGDNVSDITSRWFPNGVEELYSTISFSYNTGTGYLNHVIETAWCFDHSNPPMSKYVYEWDAQGRKTLLHKYQKRANDADWVVDIRDVYTYLPEDQSTYEEQIRYVVSEYSLSGNIYYFGHNPFLIDQDIIQYLSSEDTWEDYFLLDFVYDLDNNLVGKQRILRFMGMYELLDEARYTYEGNQVISVTFYESSTGGQMQPTVRSLYVYSEPSDSDDPHVPPVLASISTFPNPFKDSTVIQVSLPRSGTANVSIYNLRGQKVRELHSADLPRGQSQLVWDGKDTAGKNLAPGVYIIQMRSDSGNTVCKALLM